MIVKEKSITIQNFKLIIYEIEENNLFYIKAELYGADFNLIDKCETPAITQDINKANSIFDILVENNVFPCHLYNVIDEICG